MSLFLQSSPLRLPSLLFFPQSPSHPRTTFTFFPRTLTTRPLSFLYRPPPTAFPSTGQELLQALAGSSDGQSNSNPPTVRSYENDLARLTLIGPVSFEQALTAAAADGGDAAEEHLSSGAPTMVVETLFPGSSDEHSTVSTRLFLPARKVKEKAKKLRSSLTADILSSNSTVSKNILAMTFRQVVLQRLWSFELSLFNPGTERNMEDLANPREVPVHFTVSSSNERFLSALAEVVCSYALESTERICLKNVGGAAPNSIFDWFQKPLRTASVDSSVCMFRISQDEIVDNARKQVRRFNLVNGKPIIRERKQKHYWWVPPTYSRLDKSGGPGFSAWTNEYIPSYRLQIDGNMFKDARLEGWSESANNRWEVLLTHFQMVELANILDMYYEDQYTMPDKQLSCGLISDFSGISSNKSSSWKMLFLTFAGGCILISVSILAQLCWPHIPRTRKSSEQHSFVSLSETDCCQLLSLEATELEALCISIVQNIRDELGWPGEIMVDTNIGVWTGELPIYLRNSDPIQDDISCNGETTTTCPGEDVPTHADLSTSVASPLGKNSLDMQTTVQDIASYQVVLSRDGKIVGFQPTSRVAVNHWATNPLAKVLYEGRKLSPGILEPSLKVPCPHGIVLIELVMSVNPKSWFALARPIK